MKALITLLLTLLTSCNPFDIVSKKIDVSVQFNTTPSKAYNVSIPASQFKLDTLDKYVYKMGDVYRQKFDKIVIDNNKGCIKVLLKGYSSMTSTYFVYKETFNTPFADIESVNYDSMYVYLMVKKSRRD